MQTWHAWTRQPADAYNSSSKFVDGDGDGGSVATARPPIAVVGSFATLGTPHGGGPLLGMFHDGVDQTGMNLQEQHADDRIIQLALTIEG